MMGNSQQPNGTDPEAPPARASPWSALTRRPRLTPLPYAESRREVTHPRAFARFPTQFKPLKDTLRRLDQPASPSFLPFFTAKSRF